MIGTSDMIRCAFIGLGSQGAPIARRMIDARFPTTLWARRGASLDPYRDTPALFAETIEDLGAQSDHVGLCVVNDDDVREVCQRLIPAMKSGARIAIHSTIHPQTCREIAAQAERHGVEVIDAPVSGGAPAAEAGTLTLMLGGAPEVIEKAMPVFESFGKLILRVGDIGAGQHVKLINNSLLVANLGLANAALDAGATLGIDRAALVELLQASSGRSFALDVRARMENPSQFRHGGALLAKDLRLLGEVLGRESAAALCLEGAAARFLAVASPGAAADPSVPGWDEFVEGLKVLPGELLAKLPPEERDDPQYRAEVGRLMLAALTSSSLGALNGGGDHPAFVPLFGQALNLARPNADTIYRRAEISAGGTYRLRGRRGNLRIAKLGETGAAEALYHDLNELSVDAQGRYDVILSPVRPSGYTGDWWKLAPTTTQLMLRLVSDDWQAERDPTISIERLDRPVERPRPGAGELEQHLRGLPKAVSFIAGLRVGWISKLRARGLLNKPSLMNYTEAGLLAGQFYYEAAYELGAEEALLIEVREPEICGYRSLILTDEMGGTIDWTNNHSSLNGSQAQADADGVLRIIVSPKDPGIPNWLDIAGYARGGIQGRWTDCSSQPVPIVTKIAVSEVRKFVPAETPNITPAERQHIIRERRAAFQQRPLW